MKKKMLIIACLAASGIVAALTVDAADKPADAIGPEAPGLVAFSVERAKFAAMPPSDKEIEAGKEGWKTVYTTLMSPRCMNCHPNGDAPLQTDESIPHAMNISRTSTANGLDCSTCHQEQNSEAIGVKGGPPGAPHWGLPPADTPMIFEGRSVRELCEQLKRPQDNGFKTLADLHHHAAEDPLVLWGWNPGGDRTLPPVSHDEFVAAFTAWQKSGGACP